MSPGEIELPRGQVQRRQLGQVVCTQFAEFIQQRLQRAVLVAFPVAEPVVPIERTAFAVLEDDLRARHPVRFLAVDQVANDVKWTERLGSLGTSHPRSGSARKNGLPPDPCGVRFRPSTGTD